MKLVEEMQLEPGTDTLSRWMAHYIAEQINDAETLSGPVQETAKDKCYDTILRLWEHRANLPHEIRPFDKMAPILQTLASIDIANPSPRYYRSLPKQAEVEDTESESESESDLNQWLSVLRGVDNTARLLIDAALNMAASSIEVSKIKEWLEIAKKIDNSNDIQFSFRIVSSREDSGKPAEQDSNNSDAVIKNLDAFIKSAQWFKNKLLETKSVAGE